MISSIPVIAARRLSTALLSKARPYSRQDEPVKVEQLGKIRLVAINRPEKKNAVNHQTAKELLKAFKDFNNDPSAEVAVLHGIGDSFCAGYDLTDASSATPSDLVQRIQEEGADFRTMVSIFIVGIFSRKVTIQGPSIVNFEKPVIASVTGYCVAGGLELITNCDLRVGEESSKFGMLNRRFGVPTMNGGSVRLPKLIGLSRAMDLILTGRLISAGTAFDWGILNRIVPDGTALEASLELAEQLLHFPRRCMLADRNSLLHSTFKCQPEAAAYEEELKRGMEVFRESIEG